MQGQEHEMLAETTLRVVAGASELLASASCSGVFSLRLGHQIDLVKPLFRFQCILGFAKKLPGLVVQYDCALFLHRKPLNPTIRCN